MKYFKLIIVLLVLLLARSASAAEFYFSTDNQSTGGQFLIIKVMVKGENPINAIEGAISFNSQNLSLDSVDESNSVVSLWIDQPNTTDNQTINFSGIIPGGLSFSTGNGGNLFNLKFSIKAAGANTFNFTSAQAILNQVSATEDQVVLDSLTIDTQAVTQNGQVLVLDFYPPEEFQIFLYKDSSEFNGNAVIIFNTQDKGSGVNHYEVRERFLGLWGNWRRGDSPYQLLHQSLFSIIEVRAIDNIGRERLEQYVPLQLKIFWIVFWILFLTGLARGSIYLFKKHKFSKYGKR